MLLAPSPLAAETINRSVRITDTGYVPAVVTIEPGETVTWFNAGRRDHTVTSNSGTQISSGAIGHGGEITIGFDKRGTYAYHSAFLRDHLHGIVVVGGPGRPNAVTVTVTVPATVLPDRVALSPEALRSVSTSPLFARSSQRDDETGQEIGLVLAAGVTAAAVIVGLVLVGRHRAPGADV